MTPCSVLPRVPAPSRFQKKWKYPIRTNAPLLIFHLSTSIRIGCILATNQYSPCRCRFWYVLRFRFTLSFYTFVLRFRVFSIYLANPSKVNLLFGLEWFTLSTTLEGERSKECLRQAEDLFTLVSLCTREKY